MNKFLKIISFPFKAFLIALIYCYKWFISPILPNVCRFTPSCSTYAVQAIKEFGAFKGLIIAIKRILRCNPKSECGFDPLPANNKGDIKWLL